ncbi:MAG: RluA family pseudouridine synthase [Oscillospiraceae bacterium]
MAVPLDILYEDADLLALNKPAGMAVHGGYDRGEPTVANALAAYLGPDAVFHPVNRLDRGTSGVMLVARSGYVHDRLRRVLHTDGFRRTYLAAACGTGLPVSGTIDLPIARADDGTDPPHPCAPDGQPSVTDYTVLAERDGYTLLRVAAAHRPHAPDPRPLCRARPSAARRCTLRRRCVPARAPRAAFGRGRSHAARHRAAPAHYRAGPGGPARVWF